MFLHFRQKKGKKIMEIYVHHCERCLERLHCVNDATFELYVKICICAVEGDIVYKNESEYSRLSKALKMLEHRRFILTTEDGKSRIKIKVRGHVMHQNDEEENHYFCAFPDKHQI